MIPDQGQIVQVRNRRYVVDSVIPSRNGSLNNPQTLVHLSSIEDDGLGEKIAVIWEIEPGAHIFEKGAIPDLTGFDDPSTFDCFLNAVRWGSVSAADMKQLQAPFRASVELEDYQLEPLVRALEMPRVNLLIADDVGLGKTIETGLIAHELMLRQKVRTIFIVCPASLQVQWRDQMRDKFGLDFKIVNSELMKELRRSRGVHVNPWTHFPRLIASIDYIKRDRPLHLLQDVFPEEEIYPRKFDMLIVDEAHNVAPSGTGKYATDSLRTKAIKILAPHFEHKLFLTATPHNGYTESFTALLELLDNQRFARGIDIDQKQVKTVMIRRLKSDIKHRTTGEPRFATRVLKPFEVEYAAAEAEAFNLLQAYSNLRTEASASHERIASEFVLKLLKKRFFSSPQAFHNTLTKHKTTLSKPKPQKKKSSVPKNPQILKRYIENMEEEFADDDEQASAADLALDYAHEFIGEPSKEEKAALDKLLEWSSKSAAKPDSKAAFLIEWIRESLFTKGKWNNERLLIFTEYRDTQKWLLDLFDREGFMKDDRVQELHGGVRSEDREKIKAAFQAHPDQSNVRILVATDAASEGIDLQNHCHRLVHFEIPWNPNRLEQRNGRLDRHGQKASEVEVFHFVAQGYRDEKIQGKPGDLGWDLEFLYRAAKKVESIREDLLGKVGPVIASQVEEAMLGKVVNLNTEKEEKQARAKLKILKWEEDVKNKLNEYYRQVENSEKSLHIDPLHVKSVVDLGLKLAKKPALKDAKLKDYLPNPKLNECLIFEVPPLSGSWARAHEGLAHPHTQEKRPVTFDRNLGGDNDDLVHIHLNHPLVQLSANLLKSEIWKSHGDKMLHRVTFRRASNSLGDLAILLHSRLIVIGGNNQSIQEEILLSGGYYSDGSKFTRITTQKELQETADTALDEEASDSKKQWLQKNWDRIRKGTVAALEQRVKERTKNLESELERRAKKEAQDIVSVLEELGRKIQAELDEKREDPQQFLGFAELELDQYKKDREHLRRRLDELPREIEKEKDKVRRKYADPMPRVFPFGITILIPEKLDR